MYNHPLFPKNVFHRNYSIDDWQCAQAIFSVGCEQQRFSHKLMVNAVILN